MPLALFSFETKKRHIRTFVLAIGCKHKNKHFRIHVRVKNKLNMLRFSLTMNISKKYKLILEKKAK